MRRLLLVLLLAVGGMVAMAPSAHGWSPEPPAGVEGAILVYSDTPHVVAVGLVECASEPFAARLYKGSGRLVVDLYDGTIGGLGVQLNAYKVELVQSASDFLAQRFSETVCP